MAAMSNYLENKLIDFVLRGITYVPPVNTYIALLTASPSDTNVITEVSGGAYARVQVPSNTTNWAGTQGAGSTATSSGTAGTTSNNIAFTFPAPTSNWGDVVGVAVMDASTAGNVLLQGMLQETVTVSSGSPAPSFPASAISWQIDN